MRVTAMFAALLLLDAGLDAHTTDLAFDPAVRKAFLMMMKDTRFGFSHMEEAAFVVQNADGDLSMVAWPPSGEPDSARWFGRFPDGTVAIAHTHPNYMPLPSKVDAVTARKSHVPVYVVTPFAIAKTYGGAPEVVVRGEW